MSLVALAAATLAVAAPTPEAPIVVDGKPISRGYLQHWAEIAALGSGAAVPEPVGPMDRRQAVSLLVSRRWILAESRELGLPVTTREEVTASLREQRGLTFPRRAAYRRYLRETGQTTRDVRMRVALDLASDRLREHVTAGIEDADEQQAALETWVGEWRRKWSARTVCRRPWGGPDCGAGVRRG